MMEPMELFIKKYDHFTHFRLLDFLKVLDEMENKEEIKNLIQELLPENDYEDFQNDYFDLKNKLSKKDLAEEEAVKMTTPKKEVLKDCGKLLNAPKKTRKSVECSSKIEKMANLMPDTRANIKVEVVQKKGETEYKNNRGVGTYFWILVKDDTGEFKIVGYNAIVQKFVGKFEVGKTYLVNNVRVERSNKRWTTAQVDLVLSNDTEVRTLYNNPVAAHAGEGPPLVPKFKVTLCEGPARKRTIADFSSEDVEVLYELIQEKKKQKRSSVDESSTSTNE